MTCVEINESINVITEISDNEKNSGKKTLKIKNLIKWLITGVLTVLITIGGINLYEKGLLNLKLIKYYATSGQVTWQGNWAYACDWYNNDFSSRSTTADQCGPVCDSVADCTHFTWTNYKGGTCWLKKNTVSKQDALYTGDNSMVCGISSKTNGGTTNNNNGNVLFTVVNNCPYTIWPGFYGRSNTPGWQMPYQGGWQMSPYTRTDIYVPKDLTASRIWGRTGCKYSNGQFICDTGSCGPWVQCAYDGVGRTGVPPATLAEFTLNDANGQDWYDISLVDGYNVQMSIKPSNVGCAAPSCTSDLNAICPPELQEKNAYGQVVACYSACEKYQTDQYCCRGAYDTAATCKSSNWPVNYPAIFKQACPSSYSYAYDDTTSLKTCSNSNYQIVFC